MPTYPFKIPLCPYTSKRDARKRDTWITFSKELEDYINRELEASNEETVTFTYGLVALHLNIPLEVVTDMLNLAYGGHTGIRIITRKGAEKGS